MLTVAPAAGLFHVHGSVIEASDGEGAVRKVPDAVIEVFTADVWAGADRRDMVPGRVPVATAGGADRADLTAVGLCQGRDSSGQRAPGGPVAGRGCWPSAGFRGSVRSGCSPAGLDTARLGGPAGGRGAEGARRWPQAVAREESAAGGSLREGPARMAPGQAGQPWLAPPGGMALARFSPGRTDRGRRGGDRVTGVACVVLQAGRA
jgi:hypothetical protein